MILPVEAWMDLRRYQPLRDAGATWREIADEVGLDWRTVKKYLSADAPVGPPAAPSRRGTVARKIDAVASVVDAWLATDPGLKASVIHERLVAEHGFTGHYQRVKLYVAEARQRLAREADSSALSQLHRRFEVVAGAQAQVDWGDEGAILLEAGIAKVYSFHMTLSYSRDPFCCFTTSQDLGTFFDCHRRAFAHFGGVPGSIVYDRTKTVVRRHVAPREAVPLHPEAAAFAEHYGFVIDVLAARRPTGKGRVERQVAIVRDHVLAGRTFASLVELDGAFTTWVPIRRAQRHRTHGELIAVRAVADHAALRPLPAFPYLVCERHLRRVGRDCLVSFEASHYSVPVRAADGRPARAGQRVEVRVSADTVTIHRLAIDGDPVVLAAHPRATHRGAVVVDPAHWAELPDGHTRAVTLDPPTAPAADSSNSANNNQAPGGLHPLDGLLVNRPAAATPVARRALTAYDTAAGLTSTGLAQAADQR
ncbi:MAG TPA: IS21 family transposase [Pseudonocardiaceae bacterium]